MTRASLIEYQIVGDWILVLDILLSYKKDFDATQVFLASGFSQVIHTKCRVFDMIYLSHAELMKY